MDIGELDPDPHSQFDRWYDEAVASGALHPERMALATCTTGAVPSVRMVLLKGHDERGFSFFTSHQSRKAAELAANPRAALALHWEQQARQVRVEGSVERLSDDESFAYFRTRPRGSKLSAWASPQSSPIEARSELDRLYHEVERRFEGADEIPLPPFWGGYRVVPAAIEFWQGQPERLHDRILYERDGGGWSRRRLGP